MTEPIRVGDDSHSVEYGFALPISSRANLSVSQYLRERYLTPDAEQALVQAIGSELQVVIESERNDIALRMPFGAGEVHFTEAAERVLNRNGVAVGTWSDLLQRTDDGDVPARVVVLDG